MFHVEQLPSQAVPYPTAPVGAVLICPPLDRHSTLLAVAGHAAYGLLDLDLRYAFGSTWNTVDFLYTHACLSIQSGVLYTVCNPLIVHLQQNGDRIAGMSR